MEPCWHGFMFVSLCVCGEGWEGDGVHASIDNPFELMGEKMILVRRPTANRL